MDYVDGIWEINKNVAHARTQYHALWALGKLNSIVGGYDDVMHEIMKVCGFIYNNIKSRSGTEIAAWMKFTILLITSGGLATIRPGLSLV